MLTASDGETPLLTSVKSPFIAITSTSIYGSNRSFKWMVRYRAMIQSENSCDSHISALETFLYFINI